MRESLASLLGVENLDISLSGIGLVAADDHGALPLRCFVSRSVDHRRRRDLRMSR